MTGASCVGVGVLLGFVGIVFGVFGVSAFTGVGFSFCDSYLEVTSTCWVRSS